MIIGTKGTATLSHRNPGISGEINWHPPEKKEKDSHQLEHDAFFAALRDGRIINNGDYMAKSTMMAILARLSAYTGQSLTWDEGLGSQWDLSPTKHAWDGEPPEASVAVPGKTKFI